MPGHMLFSGRRNAYKEEKNAINYALWEKTDLLTAGGAYSRCATKSNVARCSCVKIECFVQSAVFIIGICAH